MRVQFTDVNGDIGVITPQLTVEYDGHWTDDIETAVFDITADFDATNDAYERQDLFLEFVVRLPEVSAVSSVEYDASAEPDG